MRYHEALSGAEQALHAMERGARPTADAWLGLRRALAGFLPEPSARAWALLAEMRALRAALPRAGDGRRRTDRA